MKNKLLNLLAVLWKEKFNKLEKKKAFEDISTGYYNFNKVKSDLNTYISNGKNISISIILFEFENIDMIKKYVDFEVSQKAYLHLIYMANELFTMGTIYAVTSSKFVVMLPEYNLEETYELAKKFILKTKNPIYIDDLPISMVVKCGIVNYPFHDSDINSIIVKLDKSLDQCCKSHNEVAIYNNIIEEGQARYYNDLVSLYHALQNNMFTLVYQPKIDIQNDKMAGVEALLRWNDSKHKNMSISELIKKAEAAGFINQITKWVIKNVAEQLKVWNQKGINTAVSINLSSRDLADESFVDYVKNCIAINEINPECIEFELTERSIIQDEKIAMEEIKKLKDMGIKISIDDYGTGFNSIKYLLEFGDTFDYLKIDKIIIDRIVSQENLIIVDCIIKAAQRVGMKVIAEGAETKEQVDILKSANCDMIQGYYYSKPLMPDELEKFILKY